MNSRHGMETVSILLCIAGALTMGARIAAAQTATHGSAAATASALPTVINSCFYYPPPSKQRLCQTWVRYGDRYQGIAGGTMGVVTVQRFDAAGAVMIQASDTTWTYSGKITGNRIQGTASFGPPESTASFKWLATFFYPPSGDPATGSHVYVGCGDKVSIINTANHSVSTVNLDDPGKPVGAIAVSADSSRAYVSSQDSGWKAAIFAIDGRKAAIAGKFPLQNSPIPSGATSLALSGDGSTLYAAGLGKSVAIVAMDAASGAIKSTQPLPKGYSGGELVMNPRLIVSGSNLVLDDATIVDAAVPGGATAIFGSDSHGLAAFPDGKRICALSTLETFGAKAVLGKAAVVTLGTKAINRRQGCSAISPDGAKTYAGGQQLLSQEGTAETNPNFGTVVGAAWGQSAGITTDGKTLYTTGGTGSMVYTIDTASSLTTDAIRACEAPQFLGMEPLHAMSADMLSAAAKAMPKGPEAVAAQDASRVIGVIDGKQITAEHAMNLLKQVAPQRERYASRLPALLQQVYMQEQIAREATELHLDKQSPWKEQLATAHRALEQWRPGPGGNILVKLQADWQINRTRILWNAYFSQSPTPEEKQALLKQKREQYKIQVQDQDFFSATP
jgi:hypothetical protein